MGQKTEAIRRELLTRLITEHGAKGRKVLVMRAKDAGIYNHYEDDAEVWELLVKFAKFHNLFIQEEKLVVKVGSPEAGVELNYEVLTPHVEKEIPKFKPVRYSTKQPEETEDDEFLAGLEREHSKLSKRLLALNKVIAIYKEV